MTAVGTEILIEWVRLRRRTQQGRSITINVDKMKNYSGSLSTDRIDAMMALQDHQHCCDNP